MALSDFFHILNPNFAKRKLVAAYFEKRPTLASAWVERQSHPTHLETIVEWALNEKKTNLAIWGGDGTLNRVLNRLFLSPQFSDTRLLLVPVGTCNDFARKIYDGSWESMLKRIDTGETQTHAYDLGVLESDGEARVFINNAGFGRSPQPIGARRSSPLQDIANFTEKKLSIRMDGNSSELAAFFGIFFNAPYFNNGMYFDKTISPVDGLLSLAVVPPQGQKALLWRFLKSKMGCGLADKNTIYLQGKEFKIESDRDLFPQVDGEPATSAGVRALTARLLPARVRLVH